MKQNPKLKPNRWDLLVALLVALSAVLCAATFWSSDDENKMLTAVISVDGEVSESVTLEYLSEPVERIVTSEGYTLQITLTKDSVWVETSDCPTQDCVHTGAISRSGQSVVCLPARVTVQLEGGSGDSNGPDLIIG